MSQHALQVPEYGIGNRIRQTMERDPILTRAVGISLLLHALLLFAALFTDCSQALPRKRSVALVIHNSRLRHELIGKKARQAAPGTDKRDALSWQHSVEQDLKDLQEKTSPSRTRPRDRKHPRRKTDTDRYSILSRERAEPDGRKHPKPFSREQINPDRTSLERDHRTRAGSHQTPGKDDRSGSRTSDPGKDDSPRARRRGNRGQGITGIVNVRGRRETHRPAFTLPPRYSRLGLSFTVKVDIRINTDGLVYWARVRRSIGRMELERILEQKARLFRFEKVSADHGNQPATITFQIRPR